MDDPLLTNIRLTPEEEYKELMKKASDRLPTITTDPEIYRMLFSEDQLKWLKSQYEKSRILL